MKKAATTVPQQQLDDAAAAAAKKAAAAKRRKAAAAEKRKRKRRERERAREQADNHDDSHDDNNDQGGLLKNDKETSRKRKRRRRNHAGKDGNFFAPLGEANDFVHLSGETECGENGGDDDNGHDHVQRNPLTGRQKKGHAKSVYGPISRAAQDLEEDESQEEAETKSPVTRRKQTSTSATWVKEQEEEDDDDDDAEEEEEDLSKRRSLSKRKRKKRKRKKAREEDEQEQLEDDTVDEEDEEEGTDTLEGEGEASGGADVGTGTQAKAQAQALWLPTQDIPEWALRQLDRELHHFANFVQLDRHEVASRERVISHVEQLARDFFACRKFNNKKRAFVEHEEAASTLPHVVTFGSFASREVCTFCSDVDLAIWGVVDPPNSAAATPCSLGEDVVVADTCDDSDDDDDDVMILEKDAVAEKVPCEKDACATPEMDSPEIFVLDRAGADDDEGESEGLFHGVPPLTVIGEEGTFLEDIINQNGVVSTPPIRAWSRFATQKGTAMVSSSSLSSEEGSGIPPTYLTKSSKETNSADTSVTPVEPETSTTGDDVTKVATTWKEEDEPLEVHEVINVTASDDESVIVVDDDDDEEARPAESSNQHHSDDDDDDDSADKMESFHAKQKKRKGNEAVAPLDAARVVAAKVTPSDNKQPQEEDNLVVNLASSPSSSEDEAYVSQPRKRSRSMTVEEKELVRLWEEEEDDAIEVSCVTHGDSENEDDDEEEEEDLPNVIGPHGKTRTRVIAALNAFGKRLRASPMTRRLEVRSKARVPIICIRTQYGFETDIALGGHSGADTSKYAGIQVQRYQSFAPVVLFLKILLEQNDLDKPFTGGLGSYKLYVLVAHHMERHLECGGSDRPSEVLLSFFYRYGQTRKEFRRRRRLQGHAISMLQKTSEVCCRNGGKADMGAVFKLADCTGIFRACFQQVVQCVTDGAPLILSGLIHVDRLHKARKTSSSRASSSLSLQPRRKQQGGGGVPHHHHKKKKQQKELHFPQEKARVKKGVAPEARFATPKQRRTSRGALVPRCRPDVLQQESEETALMHRALKRRGSKKKQHRDAALREYAQRMVFA